MPTNRSSSYLNIIDKLEIREIRYPSKWIWLLGVEAGFKLLV